MSRRSRAAAAEVGASVAVAGPVEDTWRVLTDWDRQHEWMLATRTHATGKGGHAVGGGIEARTGIGPFAVRDTMTVTTWDPPRRCTVEHTGRIVRGLGVFEVREVAGGGSRVVWTEHLDLPFGVLGRVGWPAVRPLAGWALRTSLRRLARLVEGRSTPEAG